MTARDRLRRYVLYMLAAYAIALCVLAYGPPGPLGLAIAVVWFAAAIGLKVSAVKAYMDLRG